MVQVCNRCEQLLPSSSFSRYRTVCDTCAERERTATAKACKECGEIKPLAAFPIHKSAIDGRKKVCTDCDQRQKQAARAERAARLAAIPQTTLAACFTLALHKYGPDALVESDYGRRPIADELHSIEKKAPAKLRILATLEESAPDLPASPGDGVATIYHGGYDGWHPRYLIHLPDAPAPDVLEARARRRDWARAILAAPDDWAILDTETTDNKNDPDITDIAVIDLTGRVLFTSTHLVRPTKPIHPEVVALTHITNAQISRAPEFPTVYQQFRPIIESRRLLVFNERFDIPILQRQIEQQCGIRWVPIGAECLQMAFYEYRGERHGPNHKKYAGEYVYRSLEEACRLMGVATGSQVHRALPDCRQSLALLQAMAK